MTGFTHAAVAGALGGLLAGSPQAVAVAAATGLVPDVDIPSSRAGRAAAIMAGVAGIALWNGDGPAVGLAKVCLVAWLLLRLLPHRTLTHSVWAAGLAAFAAWLLNPGWLVPALAGYLSHLLLDSLTPAGLRPLWPLGPGVRLARLPTGGWADRLLGLLAGVVAVALALF